MNKNNFHMSLGRTILMVFMLLIVVVGGTFAWFTFASKESALVLTIGNINNTQITLSPYQIKEEGLTPVNTYTSGVSSNVKVVNGDKSNRVTLFYKINELDTNLINNGLKYTIVNVATNGTENVVKTGDFTSFVGQTEAVIYDEDATKNSTTNYKVYLWVDSNKGNQNDIAGSKVDVELNGAIGSVEIAGNNNIYGETLVANITDFNTHINSDSALQNNTDYTVQWYVSSNQNMSGDSSERICNATSRSYTIGSILTGTDTDCVDGSKAIFADKYIYVLVTVRKDSYTKVYKDLADGTTDDGDVSNGSDKVLPRPVTIQANSATKTYDSTALKVNACTILVVDSNGAYGSSCDVKKNTSNGGYDFSNEHTIEFEMTDDSTITNAGTQTNTIKTIKIKYNNTDLTSNYNITKNTGTLTVNKKNVALSWGDATTFIYNGKEQAPTVTVVTDVTGETMTVNKTAGIDVGNYTSTVSCASVTGGQALCSNYTLTNTTKGFEITPKEVSVIWEEKTAFIYNGQEQAPTATVITEVAGETMSVTRTTGIDIGDYTSTASCSSVSGGRAKCSNYTLTNITKEFSIGMRTITVIANSNSKTYDGKALTDNKCTVDENVGGHTVTCTMTSASTITNAGTQTNIINTVKIMDGTTDVTDNYVINRIDGTLTIVKKNVTVTWGDVVRFEYNGSAQAPTATVTTGVTGETMVVTRTTGTNAGSYTATASCSSVTGGPNAKAEDNCKNYTLTDNTKEFEITKKELIPSASASNKEYDGTTTATVTITLTGAVSGQSPTATATCTFDTVNVGTNKTVTCSSITLGDSWKANYQLSTNSVTTTASITEKSIAVTWGSTTFTYNGSAQAPTATVETGVTGETMIVTRTTGTNAGSYTSTASCSSVSGGQKLCSNYKLTDTTKTFTITPKEVSVTWGSTKTFTYNGSAQAPTASVTTGVTGETMSVTRTTAIDIGDYISTASCSSVTGGPNAKVEDNCKNYTLTNTTKKFSIGGKGVTVTANSNKKTYDGTALTDNGCTISGHEVGHTVTCTMTDDSTITNAGTQTNKINTVKIMNDTTDVTDNYVINKIDGILTVDKKNVAVTWGSTTTFTYNGQEQTPTATVSTGVTGETMTVTRTTGINAGSYTATASCSSVTGGPNAKAEDNCKNYTLTNTTQTFTIGKRKLTPSASASNKVYDGTTTATGTITLTDAISGQSPKATATCTFDDADVGENKTVTCSNITLLTNDNGTDWTKNYQLSTTSVTTKANITEKSITVTWGNTTFTYTGSAQVPTVTTPVDGVNNEKINLTVSGAQTNVGSYTATASCSSVTGGRAKCTNYTLTSETKTTTFTIGKKQLTPSASASNKVYDGTTTATGTITLTDAISGQSPKATATCTFDDADVGENKTVTCSNITLLTNDNGTDWTKNYQLSTTSVTTKANITEKSITVTWGNTTTFESDGSSHAPTVTTPVDGVNNEKINLTVSGAQTNVGSHTATASCSSVEGGREKCTNYTITNSTRTFSIYATLTATFNYYNDQQELRTCTINSSGASCSITTPAALGEPGNGFSFNGWSSKTSASASSNVAASNPLTISSNITYYAVYKRTITGYSGLSSSKTTHTGTQYYNVAGTKSSVKLSTASDAKEFKEKPSSLGYDRWVFSGWRADTRANKGNLTDSYNPDINEEAKTLHAVYNSRICFSSDLPTSTFNYDNDGYTNDECELQYYNTSGNITSIVAGKASMSSGTWDFTGWKFTTSADEVGAIYKYGDNISLSVNSNVTLIKDGDVNVVVLYALYHRDIKYKSGINGATEHDSVRQYYNSAGNISDIRAYVPADISGWTPLCWNSNAKQYTCEYYHDTPDSMITPRVDMNGLILYAVYERTLTFISGIDKEQTDGTRTQYYNSSGNITTIESFDSKEITGWSRSGYRVDENASNGVYNYGSSKDITYPVNKSADTFYAVYNRDIEFYSGVSPFDTGSDDGADPTPDCERTQYYNSSGKLGNIQSCKPSSIGGTGTGWSALGWIDNSTDTTAKYSIYSSGTTLATIKPAMTADTELVALYSRQIIYKSGENSSWTNDSDYVQYYNSSEVLSDVEVELPVAIDGWDPIGYRYDTNATEADIVLNDNMTASPEINESNTLYAVYSRSIYFKYNNTTTTDENKTQYYNSHGSVSNVAFPTLSDIPGWTTLGWRNDTTADAAEYTGNIVSPAVTTSSPQYYSVYSRDATLYSYKSAGDSVATDTATQYWNIQGNYKVATPTVEDYKFDWKFLGWRDDTSADSKEVSIGGDYTGKESTLYAVYIKKVILKYNVNGGGGSISDVVTSNYINAYNLSTMKNSEMTIHLTTVGIFKPNYSFDGWYLNANGTGTRYLNSITITLKYSDSAADWTTTLYAKWYYSSTANASPNSA